MDSTTCLTYLTSFTRATLLTLHDCIFFLASSLLPIDSRSTFWSAVVDLVAVGQSPCGYSIGLPIKTRPYSHRPSFLPSSFVHSDFETSQRQKFIVDESKSLIFSLNENRSKNLHDIQHRRQQDQPRRQQQHPLPVSIYLFVDHIISYHIIPSYPVRIHRPERPALSSGRADHTLLLLLTNNLTSLLREPPKQARNSCTRYLYGILQTAQTAIRSYFTANCNLTYSYQPAPFSLRQSYRNLLIHLPHRTLPPTVSLIFYSLSKEERMLI